MGALNASFHSFLTSAASTKLHRNNRFLHFDFSSTGPSVHIASISKSNLSNCSLTLSRPFSTLFCASSSLTTEVPEVKGSESSDDPDEIFDWLSQWYPIMPVLDLDKRVPHAKTVMGVDVVVWWDRNEKSWKVFDDSCPHRLAPLSEGRIDQNGRLQCVYHGWCFDASGDCKLIPQAPQDGPPVHTFKKACVAVYPCTVQNEILWFWPNTNDEYKDILSKKKPPYISELDDPSYTKTFGHRDFPFGYEILIENLMDPAHVPYAHYKLLPGPPAKNRVKVDREGGAPIDINIEKLDIDGFRSNRFGGNAKFVAPCLYYSCFRLPSKDSSPQAIQQRGLVVFFCVPVGPGKSRVIYTFPRNFGVWIEKFIPRWVFHLGQNLVLDSDLHLLHLEERKILEVGPSNWQKACFVPTKSDAQVIAFRKWLKKYSDGQVNWGTKFRGALPPSPPKEQLMDRYRSHVVNCSSCSVAYKGLKALEVALQVISVGSVGILAAAKPGVMGALTRTSLVLMAIICIAASRWLAKFIYKNFHFHDYNHALL